MFGEARGGNRKRKEQRFSKVRESRSEGEDARVSTVTKKKADTSERLSQGLQSVERETLGGDNIKTRPECQVLKRGGG